MNPDAIIECVPNFSEGTDAAKVRQIVASMQVEGVRLLDWSLDTAHNRSVVTIAGSPNAVVEAAVRAVGKAADLIDLTRQAGVHPRIGAADVVPSCPSAASPWRSAQCLHVRLVLIEGNHGVLVYFYSAAATRPDRVQLEDVRRGQFEGLREASPRDTARRPDVGGPELHPTAGASAVGARSFLIAYNIYLAPDPVSAQPPDISIARSIARDIRASNGGMQGVKAIGVIANGRPQVSMNITEYRATSVRDVHAAVGKLARRYGVQLGDGELIGLIPEAAYEPDSDWIRQIPGFDPADRVLERRLDAPMEWPKS